MLSELCHPGVLALFGGTWTTTVWTTTMGSEGESAVGAAGGMSSIKVHEVVRPPLPGVTVWMTMVDLVASFKVRVTVGRRMVEKVIVGTGSVEAGPPGIGFENGTGVFSSHALYTLA